MTPKPCKWCGSIWHSKNKCPTRASEPLPEGFLQKRTHAPLSPKKPSEALRTRQSGTSERSELIRRADKLFSPFVRMRNMTWYFTNYCFTCGVELPWGELQNGHFMSRRYLNTRWDVINCQPQCNDCNVVKGGNLEVFEQKLRKKYGDQVIDGLIQRAKSGNKVSLAEIQGVIDLYKSE